MRVYVARQPIFDVQQWVQGYELLFRSDLENVFPDVNGNKASISVLDAAFMSIGIERLTGGKRAFINFTDELLRQPLPIALPKETVVIEILESVEPDETIIKACEDLKARGYTLALDDFKVEDDLNPLAMIADIIKVDFLDTPYEQCRRVVEDPRLRHVTFLAEKVETKLVRARSNGGSLLWR